jgi:pSer/pThr/pTyr-binding forkhead associated (FHA) protein
MMAGSVWRISALDRDGHPVGSCDLAAGELTIGRDADRQLILPSASVSRRHARLYLDGGMQLCIVDEGSANGVIVDGVRITAPTYVNAATRIDLAEFRIAVEPLGGAASPGARQPRATPVPGTIPSDAPALPAMRLVAEGGPYDGRVYDLAAQELAVGRAVDNDIVLDDPSLSRKHAKLRRAAADELEVEDLNSSNGTYVNGRKVGRGGVHPGDVVRFGELNFRVEGDTSHGTRAVAAEIPQGQLLMLIGGAALTLIMLIAMLAVLLHKPKPVQAPGRPALAKIQKSADDHVDIGKKLLDAHKYGEAKKELDQALELDPANSEARKMETFAAQVPVDEKIVLSAQADIAVGDRKGLESALHLLDETMVGTPGHDKLLAKLTSGLVRFGVGQCTGRAWSDCAWALCKAYEVAPADQRPDASAQQKLREAEKKIRDKSYARCRAVP